MIAAGKAIAADCSTPSRAPAHTPQLPESEIEPVESLPKLADLGSAAGADVSSLLSQTAVLKLNGGLGTSMGLEKAKSLLVVKDGKTFLDLIAEQVEHMRAQYGSKVRFVLMDSFSTSEDTRAHLKKTHPGRSVGRVCPAAVGVWMCGWMGREVRERGGRRGGRGELQCGGPTRQWAGACLRRSNRMHHSGSRSPADSAAGGGGCGAAAEHVSQGRRCDAEAGLLPGNPQPGMVSAGPRRHLPLPARQRHAEPPAGARHQVPVCQVRGRGRWRRSSVRHVGPGLRGQGSRMPSPASGPGDALPAGREVGAWPETGQSPEQGPVNLAAPRPCSNSDNLGATLDLDLLAWFAGSGKSFVMEVAERTPSDKKGGHLAKRTSDGRLILRESAQCPDDDKAAFENISK